eukprot:m.132681 g.132681  ORF g.132681 m.132681 type:complete len:209 (-) comp14652_c0_seq3:2327-2953(-)
MNARIRVPPSVYLTAILLHVDKSTRPQVKSAKLSKREKEQKKRTEARLSTISNVIQDIEEDEKEDDDSDNSMQLKDQEEDPSSQLDNFPQQMEGGEATIVDDEDAVRQAKAESVEGTLFKDSWFFLSREVPKYSLEFVIRSFGGHVSWQGIGDQGAGPYSEDDARITHHVVDRPNMKQTHLQRHYIQPQWVYDCVNAKKVSVVVGFLV